MKKNILVALEDLNANAYLNYVSFLAKDYDIPLKLVSTIPPVSVNPNPVAIVGGGIERPPQMVSDKVEEENKKALEDIIERLSAIHKDITYDLSKGYLMDRVMDESLQKTALLWTLRIKSDDSFFNRIWGTRETEFTRESLIPCLSIPGEYNYVKPKNIMIVIRGTENINFDKLDKVLNTFDLKPTFAFHEDEGDINVNKVMELLNTGLTRYTGALKTTLLSTDEEIEKTFEEEKPDWLSFINYERSFFERIFKENINHLLLKYKKPILSL